MASIRFSHIRLLAGALLIFGGIGTIGDSIIGGLLLTVAGLLCFNPIREAVNYPTLLARLHSFLEKGSIFALFW